MNTWRFLWQFNMWSVILIRYSLKSSTCKTSSVKAECVMYPDTFETQHSVFWEHKLPPAGSWVLDPWDPDLGLHQGQLPIGLRPPPAGMGAQISWRCVALGLLYSWGLWMVRFCLWLLGHYCGFLIFKYISCERHIHSPNLSLFFSLTLTQTPQRKTCLSFLRHCHTVTTYSVITEIG